ncbi:TadE/TadG family type IV pilus assembly protein [Streptomyces sp.]|uniref:TadE/TadG family type IV pilus assembly protein n=1 Tax=Streptomyces sp. TaxID=1931 RepID=UPI0028126518|nr:TadE/TadG family type IV pilus assembly protein [Streptomyces sp.]
MNLWRSERGAAAVEFALVLPLLLLIVLGTIEFGRAYNAQISLTHAARESARTMAITSNWVEAVSTGRSAAPSLNSTAMTFTPSSTTCTANSTVNVTVTYPLQTVTGIADNMTLTGKAAMRCGG